jgi:hypothetical protein
MEQMPPWIHAADRGWKADPARKSVSASGIPRMHRAPRVAIVGNRLSAGILTDGKGDLWLKRTVASSWSNMTCAG